MSDDPGSTPPSTPGSKSEEAVRSAKPLPAPRSTSRPPSGSRQAARGSAFPSGRRIVLTTILSSFVLVGVIALWAYTMFFMEGRRDATIGYQRVAWSDLPGWQDDTLGAAMPALLRSCRTLDAREATDAFHPTNPVLGSVGAWQSMCREARMVGADADAESVRAFFENRFEPARVYLGHATQGLMTGYFEPELQGSLIRDETYNTPIRQLPDDLVQVDLGLFRDDLRGRRVAGRIREGRLVPYEDRANIEAGALGTQERVLVWVDSAIDAFFLHIQGSGRVRLPDGEILRVGYAGQNGHPYTPIGRVLIDEGRLSRDRVTMQSIRAWLAAHPDEAPRVMAANASYIFFRPIDVPDPDLGPLGAEGVPLTPGRSLAVDPLYHAYGMPIWLDTAAPASSAADDATPFRRLMVAQDTGGAIRGAVRGDIFFGHGEEAANRAGRMNAPGQFFVLLPVTVTGAGDS